MMLFVLCFLNVAQAFASPVNFFDDLENFKKNNLNLSTEKQNLEATSTELLSKKLFWTPKLSVSTEKSKTKLNSDKVIEDSSFKGNLSLNLFRGGSDINQLKEASAQNKAQELQLTNEALRVEIKASDLIFKSLYLIETKRIQEQILKLKEESLKIITDRYHQGKLPLQEVTKTEVDLIQQKNKLRSAQLDFVENKSQISSFFIDEIKTSNWPFVESIHPKILIDSKIPLVEQKYWMGQSREQAWIATKGYHWPTLDLQVQYQKYPLDVHGNHQMSGVLALTFPLWDQLETSAKVAASFAQYVSAQNDFKEAEKSFKVKSLFLIEKIEVARINLVESKKNLETSRKLYFDILKSFRLGRISTNDLFIEQNRLLESENALAASQLTFHQSLIETCALFGLKSAECLL
jgi:outer membrane protein TolC